MNILIKTSVKNRRNTIKMLKFIDKKLMSVVYEQSVIYIGPGSV